MKKLTLGSLLLFSNLAATTAFGAVGILINQQQLSDTSCGEVVLAGDGTEVTILDTGKTEDTVWVRLERVAEVGSEGAKVGCIGEVSQDAVRPLTILPVAKRKTFLVTNQHDLTHSSCGQVQVAPGSIVTAITASEVGVYREDLAGLEAARVVVKSNTQLGSSSAKSGCTGYLLTDFLKELK